MAHIHILRRTQQDIETQKNGYYEVRQDMLDTRVHEGLLQASRLMQAMRPFEECLENSGLLRFNADAYLEEM